MALPYSVKSAARSLIKEKWINILSILTIASSLLIITLTSFTLYNLELATSRLPERFSMVVYLKIGISKEETQTVINNLKNRPEIDSIKYIPKETAFKELKQQLKDAPYILEGLGENPLASSIELKLKKKFVTESNVNTISKMLKNIQGVDDIYYGEKIAETIYLLKRSVENISIIIFLSIAAGVVFVTYSTVKILFYRKKDEIEIFKLLGATSGFIRTPFIIEGSVIGFFGGVLSIIGALIFYFVITYRLSAVIPILKNLAFPLEFLIALPVIGIFLGIVGSLIAIGRLRL
jgi:cell division transport system permease protein